MSTLAASLLPKDIHLELKSTDPRDALEEVLSTLRTDPRVTDWEKLRSSLQAGTSINTIQKGCGTIILHHRRTISVSGLVLAVGRSSDPISLATPDEKLRLLFVAAIPSTLNNEYLRILGAIARVCNDPVTFGELLSVPDTGGFLSLLEKGCRQ